MHLPCSPSFCFVLSGSGCCTCLALVSVLWRHSSHNSLQRSAKSSPETLLAASPWCWPLLLGVLTPPSNQPATTGVKKECETTELKIINTSWKQPKCLLIDELINKMWYICTMEYYSTIKSKEILSFATPWMNLEHIMLSEISQIEEDKYYMVSLICEI